MRCIITGKQRNQFTNYDETMNMPLNAQTGKAKEKPQFSHGGPSLRQISGTDPMIKDLSYCHH